MVGKLKRMQVRMTSDLERSSLAMALDSHASNSSEALKFICCSFLPLISASDPLKLIPDFDKACSHPPLRFPTLENSAQLFGEAPSDFTLAAEYPAYGRSVHPDPLSNSFLIYHFLPSFTFSLILPYTLPVVNIFFAVNVNFYCE